MVAQQDDNEILSEILTNAAESDDEDLAETADMDCEYVEDLLENKIDLSNCSEADLKSLPILNAIQFNDLTRYIERYGKIKSYGELKGVPSLAEGVIKLFKNYTIISDSIATRHYTPGEMITKGQHSIASFNKAVLEPQAAYITDSTGSAKYQGSRMIWNLKYRYKYKDRIAWGITTEKDAGESIGFGNRKYGFDYYSIFLRINKLGIIDKLIIGDYTVKFGQGLMLGGGFSMGKSMNGNGYSGSVQIREYGSVNENRYYRGAAATIAATPKLHITAFASANLVDATCEDSCFHSFKTDGYHRTDRELTTKDNLRETIGGAMVEYHSKKIQLGAATYYYNYDKKFIPREQLRYAQMYSCRNGVGASICYRFYGEKINIYGETAMDKHGNIATINTADIMPAANYRVRLLHRYYSPKYQAFKAQSFGQNSRTSNEDGFYIGLITEPCKWLSVETWADVFQLPWAGSYNKMPTTGNEAMMQCKLTINRRFHFSVRLKHKERRDTDLDDGTTKTGYAKVSSIFNATDALSLTSTAQWSRSDTGDDIKEHGYLVSQDLKWSANSFPLSLTARYALFSAPYNARIYAYENDVRGASSSPGYFYEGQRIYLMAACKIGHSTTVQVKISQWQYFDRETISSGDSKIDGRHKSEISMYFKYSF